MIWEILAGAGTAVLCYLFCICPGFRQRKQVREFIAQNKAIAHRGLFDNTGPAPENSIAAFKHAAEAGYAIELDVRLTSDGRVVVVHDETLTRVTGVNRPVSSMTCKETAACRLFESNEHLPLASEVLKLIDGQVPLIVEIKAEISCAALCKKTAEILDGYNGQVCIESFSPFALRWFRRHRPSQIRGQLASRFVTAGEDRPPWYQRPVIANLLMNVLARPDFIAYDIRHPHQISLMVCRKLFRVPVIGWTARGTDEIKQASELFDAVIFEQIKK